MKSASPRLPLRRAILADEAYEALRDIVLDSGRFGARDKLSVEALARELGVNRSPVWSAIARLEADGLLAVLPRQGVFFIAADSARISAVLQTREALEEMAARLAAQRLHRIVSRNSMRP